MKKLIPLAIAAVLIPSVLVMHGKHTAYRKATIEFNKQTHLYQMQKALYEDLASVCERAKSDMNASRDSMSMLVSDAMINGMQKSDLAQQGEYSKSFNQAHAFVRDNCGGIEYSAPVPPTPPKF